MRRSPITAAGPRTRSSRERSSRSGTSDCPSNAVARWMASSVRTGSFGKGLLESLHGNGADEDAIALDEGQRGAQDELGAREHLTHGGPARLAQQPGEDCARLGVDVQRSSRSSSSRRSAAPAGRTGSRSGQRSGRLAKARCRRPLRSASMRAVWALLSGWAVAPVW